MQVKSIVSDGVLKPDEWLPLADQTRVQLTIGPIVEETQPVAAWKTLKARLRLRPIHGTGKRFSREELHERR